MLTQADALTPVRNALTKLTRDVGREGMEAIMSVFLEVTPQNIDAIQHAIEAGDKKMLAYEAHKLKGACGVVGLESIRELAIKLEQRAKAQALDEAPQICAAIRSACVEMAAAYERGFLVCTAAAGASVHHAMS